MWGRLVSGKPMVQIRQILITNGRTGRQRLALFRHNVKNYRI
jgi:hypothetical protein